ncbi:MAG: SIMPL domain-containing protein [Ignavibacteriaceae bacterium]|nr:SIMPL domain-containing protein [Ignavibacteriaceae bacterium]
MKFILGLSLLLFLNCNLFGQQYLGDNKLVIEGNSDLIIESDRASFNFSILGFGSSLREAVVDAQTKIINATQTLSKYGISKRNISTSAFESGENFGAKAFLSSSKDFKTLMTVFVIIDSLPNLEDIIIGMTENGIESISNVNYSLKNFEKYKIQSKENAIEDAKQKAKQIADKFGITLKKVIYIEESGFFQNYPNPFNPTTRIMNDIIPTSVSLYSKPVKISQKIKVVYAIE